MTEMEIHLKGHQQYNDLVGFENRYLNSNHVILRFVKILRSAIDPPKLCPNT